MTDDKKIPDGVGEIDWDQALSEWDSKSFDPEVAKDVVSDQPAALGGTPAPRALYRPPVMPAAKPKPAPPRPPPGAASRLPKPPEPEEREEETRVTEMSSALRAAETARKRPPPRGGLGQMFARDEKRDASANIEDSQSKVAEPAAPLPVPDEEPFDPFSEPRSEQPTIPADDEIAAHFGARTSPPSRTEPPTYRAEQLGGPALLVPQARQYDPNEDTAISSTTGSAHARAAVAAMRAAAAGQADTSPPGPPEKPPAAPVVAAPSWPDERAAIRWLDEGAREALVSRATWLEEEARALGDKIAQARGLLACSEILATTGDRERAHALAREARDMAPSLALGHRQARALAPPQQDAAERLQELDAEVKMTPAGPGRLHSTLLAAEAARTEGDEDATWKRLDQAARTSTADVRAAIARATRALAHGETNHAALRLPESPEVAQVAHALAVCLRLRGVERKDADDDEPLANEVMSRARQALEKGDVASAAPMVARIASVTELAAGARWLAAALAGTRQATRPDSVRWLSELAGRGDDEAYRAVVARAIEMDDRAMLTRSIAEGGPLTSAERVALSSLAAVPVSASDPHLEATATMPGMRALAAAVAAVSVPAGGAGEEASAQARANYTAGSEDSRNLVRLGRLLAASAPWADIEPALSALGDAKPAAARAVALEMAARASRVFDVSVALEAWGAERGSAEDRAIGGLAAALVAERAGNRARALESFKAARAADPTNEAALRAISSLEPVDLVAELTALADVLAEGPRSAIARIEAVTRGETSLPERTRVELLERAQRAAPAIPIASFLGERVARRAGDVDGVLRWVRERRAAASDAVEAALDAVREALLVADKEPGLAGELLLEAHHARPADTALRELYERMAPEPPEDSALWREQRATEATGEARTLQFLEAARLYEGAGDQEGALRCAEAASAYDAPLARIARERAELQAGRVARLAEELLALAKTTEDPRSRREAYERLAELDATARQDPASALLWHRSILEEAPEHEPSLRHVEHHLVGEGRDDELEPIASSIARLLQGTGAGECTAHAELAARLRARGTEGSWESTREMVELAAAEQQPSLWSLRMLQAHARARSDEEAFLATTLRLLERASRPVEVVSLLVRAGEAASRLGQLAQSRSLLERATTEDPGDVVAWGLLADVRQRAGDARGAAEACESLARSSLVRAHQLLAWYDAGRIWQDDEQEEERATIALEAAAAIDVAHADVFERLSRIYVSRKMQPELAALLERRLDGVTDPDERLAMAVQRGRILLEVGDTDNARQAFEEALGQRPDDPGALSAFADLCVAQRDWDRAEQSLVRLARLLPTPEEQRDVYARLGDLYSHHLLNLSRAEVALKEVLKRAPDDAAAMEKLVDVYKRQNDPARATELQRELVTKATSPEDKRTRTIALASIYEQTAHDNRRAEQTLEGARREFPQDVGVLRALAEFYVRHHQAPAVNILLDRAGADARRSLAAGRFSSSAFEILGAVYELRGKMDAARTTQALLAALEGRPMELHGAGERAFDPRLDDLLAPEVLTPAMRALLAKTGEALDAASPLDLRELKATPMHPDTPIARLAWGVGQATGLGVVQVLVSPMLGATCVAVGSVPPVLVVGQALGAVDERAAAFLTLRALKLVRAKASALARTSPMELAVLVSAWLKCFNPTWQPQGVNVAALNTVMARVRAALPRNIDADVGIAALEVAGNLGTQAATLAANAVAWSNRVALLAAGDPNSALEAIAIAAGSRDGAPRAPQERAAWVARTPEARDVIGFGVTDAFAEARARLGLAG